MATDGDTRSAAKESPTLLRDQLANERTFLAWLRTGVAITALGFVVARFEILLLELARIEDRDFNQSELAAAVGVLLVSAGPILVIIAAIRFRLANRALAAGRVPQGNLVSAVIFGIAIVLGLVGIGLVAHLVDTWPG